MENLAKKQVNTKLSFDISLFNKCFDVIEKLYNTGATSADVNFQRAYFTDNDIIVKKKNIKNKSTKEKTIATFPKKEVFEYLGSKLVDTTKNKVDTTKKKVDTAPSQVDTISNSGDTQKKLINVECTLYKNTYDTTTDTKITFGKLLENIKNGAYKDVITKLRNIENEEEQKQIKTKDLKPFSISGHCLPIRNKQNFMPSTYTNLIQIDVDYKDNQGANFDVLRKKFIDLEFVFTCFTSPRGNGLKALVLHNLGYEKHEQAFEYFEQYFLDNFHIKIDKQCKNIDRICYVSFDDDLYLNENCKPLHIDLNFEKKASEPIRINQSTTTFNNVFDFAVFCTQKIYRFVNGQKSIFRVVFSKIAFIYGANEIDILNYVLQNFPSVTGEAKVKSDVESGLNYGKKETQRTFISYNEFTGAKIKDIHKHNKEPYNKPFEKSKQVQEPNKNIQNNVQKQQNYNIDYETGEILETNNFFSIATIKKNIMVATTKPQRKQILSNCFYSNSLSFLYGDNGTGKSYLAIQIADGIAKGKKNICGFDNELEPTKVLYFDFELTDVDLLQRYDKYDFSDNLLIANINISNYINSKESEIFEQMKLCIEKEQAKIIIIDNLTALANGDLSKRDIAKKVINGLLTLKELGISILVLAHTPKIKEFQPASKNDLAGSKIFSDLADTIFCIAKTQRDDKERYIISLKTRGNESFTKNNVLVLNYANINGLQGFVYKETNKESVLLMNSEVYKQEIDKANIRNSVFDLAKEGYTQTKIANDLGIPQYKVSRILANKK